MMKNSLVALLQTISAAAGLATAALAAEKSVPLPTGPQTDGPFRKVILEADKDTNGDGQIEDTLKDPMELAVALDGRVLNAQRNGIVKVWKPDTQTSVEIGAIQVYDQMEDGLLGLALDPQFARNGWIYLFHSLPDTTLDPAGKKVGENLVCRYTLKGDTLDLASEFGTAWGNNLDTQLIRIAYAGKS